MESTSAFSIWFYKDRGHKRRQRWWCHCKHTYVFMCFCKWIKKTPGQKSHLVIILISCLPCSFRPCFSYLTYVTHSIFYLLSLDKFPLCRTTFYLSHLFHLSIHLKVLSSYSVLPFLLTTFISLHQVTHLFLIFLPVFTLVSTHFLCSCLP